MSPSSHINWCRPISLARQELNSDTSCLWWVSACLCRGTPEPAEPSPAAYHLYGHDQPCVQCCGHRTTHVCQWKYRDHTRGKTQAHSGWMNGTVSILEGALPRQITVGYWCSSVDDSRNTYPDSKVHGANMGPIWGRQDPVGPHVGPMNFAIWVSYFAMFNISMESNGQ